ncbi:MAG: GMC family oxidoreductase, partial [Alphaproteobacteria bacterium]|nr:GMC family oxidoreductase [Alphaproteobacteria bacterium]
GCSRKDKGSIDLTYLKEAVDTGYCTIRPQTNVLRILGNNEDQISAIECFDGKSVYKIEVRNLIIAGGAIETPRLLLLSKDDHSPNGIGNDSGEVGKNFMETLFWTSSGISNIKLESYRGLPADSICWDYNAPDSIPNTIGGCRFSPSVIEADLAGPEAYATRVAGGWGKQHKSDMARYFGNILSVSGIAESIPHPKSHILLSTTEQDVLGLPKAKISSYVDDLAIKRIEFMAKKCRQILESLDVKIIEEHSAYDIFSSTHVFGTCRMGDNPKTSVVDPSCRSHRWNNLYIMDASVFPSSGGGESPGLTIQAIALRAASKLAKRLKS